MMAYGTMFAERGAVAALRRIASRCLRIYVVQISLLLITLLVVGGWTAHFRLPALAVAPILDAGWDGLVHALTLRALPGYLDILPLYIVLLAAFPLIYFGMRRSVPATLAASVALWGYANFDHSLNLPNWIDGKGWYFNPFTWQLLFAIGASLALQTRAHGSMTPRNRWIAAVCWAYLAFAFVQGASWSDWNLPSLRPFDMAPPDKQHLSPLRVLDILALLYLFMSSRWIAGLMRNGLVKLVATLGKHSLEVFAVGCTFALFGRLILRTYGAGAGLQIGLNILGMGAMVAVALVRERGRAKARSEALALAAGHPREAGYRGADFGVYRAG
jgi:hypothetical protein